MQKKVTVIMSSEKSYAHNLKQFVSNRLIETIITVGSITHSNESEKIINYNDSYYISGRILSKIIDTVTTEYFIILKYGEKIEISEKSIEKFINYIMDTGAGMAYSDFKLKNSETVNYPVIDYKNGSIRDDFDFGPVCFFNTSAVKEVLLKFGDTQEFNYSALYDLRLKLSIDYKILHIMEFLYYKIEQEEEDTHFNYVDPGNFEIQKELEITATCHLKRIGAYLKPEFKKVEYNEKEFDVKASIVIPVKNRNKTIGDAVRSSLCQKTDFKYNIIIIDNHSTDGTTGIIKKLSKEHENIIHIIPEKKELLIGGCWNKAILNKNCGMFAVQLDSDDLYTDKNTLQKIVDAFYNSSGAAAVVGAYRIVDFNLKAMPPGIIDHKEWTPENGHNNALRVNGFGAPRSYYTPIIRDIQFPDVSYGEDYSVMLQICREYKIARIYEPIYLCRRWADNSDTDIDILTKNRYNEYKDSLRTKEISIRQNETKIN